MFDRFKLIAEAHMFLINDEDEILLLRRFQHRLRGWQLQRDRGPPGRERGSGGGRDPRGEGGSWHRDLRLRTLTWSA